MCAALFRAAGVGRSIRCTYGRPKSLTGREGRGAATEEEATAAFTAAEAAVARVREMGPLTHCVGNRRGQPTASVHGP